MPRAPKSFRPADNRSKATIEKGWESRRNGNHDLYNLWTWRKPVHGIRARVLQRDPLCVVCRKEGKQVLSTEADHITPHAGDMALFLSMDNLQGLCKACHSRKTMNEQRYG